MTTKQSITLTKLGDLLAEPDQNTTWLVDGLLPAGGFSVLGAKPKVGKSTLARNLALCVGNGAPFLGRTTTKGPVIYLALEEKRDEIKKHFADMGAAGDEDVYVHCASAPANGIEQMGVISQQLKPALVIIDPLFRFIRVKDTNDYASVTAELDPLLALARDTGAHIMMVHHLVKSSKSGGDGLLGSTAIFGSVDSTIILRRHETARSIQAIQRYGTDLPESDLTFDTATRTMSLGRTKDDIARDRLEESITAHFSNHPEPITEPEITAAVQGKTQLIRETLRGMVAKQVLKREGKGSKGDAFKYSILVPALVVGTREQETDKA